jgi:hypothetical protein
VKKKRKKKKDATVLLPRASYEYKKSYLSWPVDLRWSNNWFREPNHLRHRRQIFEFSAGGGGVENPKWRVIVLGAGLGA